MFFIREDIIRAFKRGIFPYIDGFKIEKESDEETDKESYENEETDTTDLPYLESEESIEGQGLKILLAQLIPGNNSEKLKTKLSTYYILCTDQNNIQKMSIIIWSTLFKNGNNLYEHWKQ